MSQIVIREITGVKSIESLIEHLNIVKNTFENDPIEITVEYDIDYKDKVIVYFKRVKNNE
jgi:hypothetical protein